MNDQKKLIFEALTGRKGASISSKEGNAKSMLIAGFGTIRKGETVVDTRKAAKSLGVSQRTVQRWIKGTNKPASTHLEKLKTRSRQAATTKRGRERAVKSSSRAQSFAAKGAMVRIEGTQGPGDYKRKRSTQISLSPEQFEQLMESYAIQGDEAAVKKLENFYSSNYVDDWSIGAIDTIRIDENLGRQDPRAL